jgi:hypothetical protein
MLCTTADAAPAGADAILMNQRIEGQNLQAIRKGTSSAQQLTVSFWVKSNVTGTYIVEFADQDNARSVSAAYSIASSATWEKKTIVIPADTTGAFDNDNDNSLSVAFWLGSGSDRTSGTLNTSWASTVTANRVVGQENLAAATNNYWQVTGVQLEVDAVATPFEFKPFAQDLIECQRYYYRITESPFGNGQAFGTGGAVIDINFLTTMRAKPTALEQSGTAADYKVSKADSNAQNLSSVPTFLLASTQTSTIQCNVTANLVAGNSSTMNANNTNAFLAWSAEL